MHCEYPVDADEEYVEESGFKAPCPGEFTRLSSALALFRAARILSRTLEEVYPAVSSYELSLQKLASLNDELDQWQQSLAPHLRLPFANDKPSAGTTSSRSPLLSLTYHYIRALIHRPAVTAGLGNRASSSALALAASCKHSIQIIDLLAERGLGFSFCLNKDELIVLSGLGLLYQSLDLDATSKLYKDIQKMVGSAASTLQTTKSPCAAEFSKIARNFLPVKSSALKKNHMPLSRHNSDGDLPQPNFLHLSPPQQTKLQKAAQRLGIPIDGRRATLPNISAHQIALKCQSQPNLAPHSNPVQISRSEPAHSPANLSLPSDPARPSAPPASVLMPALKPKVNLDYLSFSGVPTRTHSPDPSMGTGDASTAPIKTEPTDWERLLGSIDGSHTNIFDNIYGGPAVEFLGASESKHAVTPPNPHGVKSSGSLESLAWNSPADLQWALSGAEGMHAGSFGDFKAQPESVFSMSDEGSSTNNGDDLFSSGNDWGSVSSSNEAYAGIVMPEFGSGDDGLMSGTWESAVAI